MLHANLHYEANHHRKQISAECKTIRSKYNIFFHNRDIFLVLAVALIVCHEYLVLREVRCFARVKCM